MAIKVNAGAVPAVCHTQVLAAAVEAAVTLPICEASLPLLISQANALKGAVKAALMLPYGEANLP